MRRHEPGLDYRSHEFTSDALSKMLNRIRLHAYNHFSYISMVLWRSLPPPNLLSLPQENRQGYEQNQVDRSQNGESGVVPGIHPKRQGVKANIKRKYYRSSVLARQITEGWKPYPI
jgi:hypothetical protein